MDALAVGQVYGSIKQEMPAMRGDGVDPCAMRKILGMMTRCFPYMG